MTAREGRSEGLAGKQPGCILRRLAGTAADGAAGASCEPLRAQEPQRKPVRTSGKGKKPAVMKNQRRPGNAAACEPGPGWAPAALRNSCSHHRVRCLGAPLPGPGPRGKLPTPGEPALPFGQRWPRGDAQGQQPTAGKSRRHRAEGPGSRRRLGGDSVQGGRLPQVAIAAVSGYRRPGQFRRSPLLQPNPEPAPPVSLPGSGREKTTHRATHSPQDPPGSHRGRGAAACTVRLPPIGKSSSSGPSGCTASSPLPAPVNSATDPGSPADGGSLHLGQALPKK
uniref:collagen alpha-1(I) chain-like n=1 Tax=Agelaius phoeniceus TaxID=39638 RepID=UPI0023ED4572|nr:collagen alpha-1(I) chain-like [Agelaius phoeniceus]